MRRVISQKDADCLRAALRRAVGLHGLLNTLYDGTLDLLAPHPTNRDVDPVSSLIFNEVNPIGDGARPDVALRRFLKANRIVVRKKRGSDTS